MKGFAKGDTISHAGTQINEEHHSREYEIAHTHSFGGVVAKVVVERTYTTKIYCLAIN